MSENLVPKIIKEIEKTGFPLELRISDFLRSRDYIVEHGISYLDKDEGKGREIDLVARRFVAEQYQRKRYFIDNILTIECKKSDKPWVVFSSPVVGDDLNLFRLEVSEGLTDNEQNWSLEKTSQIIDTLLEFHPLFNQVRRGRNYFIPFAGFEANEMIFKALTTSTKAALALQERPSLRGNRVTFYYPIIVFQGKLFEAYLQNGEIQVVEAQYVAVDFSYRSNKYAPTNVVIPIITESAFGDFLSSLEKVFDYWVTLSRSSPELFVFSKNQEENPFYG